MKNVRDKVSSIDVRLTSDVVLTNITSGLTAETAHWTLCLGHLKKLKEEMQDNNNATSTLQQLEGALRNINPQLDNYDVIDNNSNDNEKKNDQEGDGLACRLEYQGNDDQVKGKELRNLVRLLSYP